MAIVSLDHIAIAVDDMAAGIRRFCDDMGLTLEGTEDVVSARTSTAFIPIQGTRIELIHPLHGEGPIATFLERKGPGLHHLCFRTDDIEGDMTLLASRGYRFLSESPQPGAHGTRIVFLHPRSCGGVLIELAEHPGAQP